MAEVNLFGLAYYITNQFWWSFWPDEDVQAPYRFNLTDEGNNAKGDTITYNVTGHSQDANGLTEPWIELVEDVLDYFGEVMGITFVEVTDESADLLFCDDVYTDTGGERAYALPLSFSEDGYIEQSLINITPGWHNASFGETDISDEFYEYEFQTVLHELCHAFGLGHQGFYNANSTLAAFEWDNESWQSSIMSYVTPSENADVAADDYFVHTLMAVDMIALQLLYYPMVDVLGSQHTGDTVYGFTTNLSPDDFFYDLQNFANLNLFCITDSGGVDTVNFAGYSDDQIIDLTVTEYGDMYPTVSSIGGLTDNMTLSVGTVIENAYSGAGDDVMIGNEADNFFDAGGGADDVYGAAGDDNLYGNGGNDTLHGGGGNDLLEGDTDKTISDDILIGDGGDDTLRGGNGDDRMNGGYGNDTVEGGAGEDLLIGFGGKDELTGGDDADVFLLIGDGHTVVDFDKEDGDIVIRLGKDGFTRVDDGAAVMPELYDTDICVKPDPMADDFLF